MLRLPPFAPLELDSVTSVALKLLQLLSEVAPPPALQLFVVDDVEPLSLLHIILFVLYSGPYWLFVMKFAFVLCPIPACFPRDIALEYRLSFCF